VLKLYLVRHGWTAWHSLRVDCGSISCLSLRSQNSARPSPAARLEFLNLTGHLVLPAVAGE
jgi:hypothetical protein